VKLIQDRRGRGCDPCRFKAASDRNNPHGLRAHRPVGLNIDREMDSLVDHLCRYRRTVRNALLASRSTLKVYLVANVGGEFRIRYNR
jgi:hypothetical protein